MKIYEIDTGYLEARPGVTMIRMVSVKDMVKELKLLEPRGGSDVDFPDIVEIIEKLGGRL